MIELDDENEGLFKSLKNIENAQKNLIRDDDNESIYYTPRSEFDDKDDKYIYIKKIFNVRSKLPNTFKSNGKRFDG